MVFFLLFLLERILCLEKIKMSIFTVMRYRELIADKPRTGASSTSIFYSDNQTVNFALAGLCGIVVYAAISAAKG